MLRQPLSVSVALRFSPLPLLWLPWLSCDHFVWYFVHKLRGCCQSCYDSVNCIVFWLLPLCRVTTSRSGYLCFIWCSLRWDEHSPLWTQSRCLDRYQSQTCWHLSWETIPRAVPVTSWTGTACWSTLESASGFSVDVLHSTIPSYRNVYYR